MTAPARSPSDLGGIGTMLSQVEICPNCGLSHAHGSFAMKRPEERGCSRAVVGAIPYLSRAWESSAYSAPEEVVLSLDENAMFPAPLPRRYSAKDPPLAVHLPPPPELEEGYP